MKIKDNKSKTFPFIPIWLFFFIIIHVLHFKYLTIHVILYSVILDIILTSILINIYYVIKLQSINQIKKNIQPTILLASLALNYGLIIPTTIDRSVSLYLLNVIATEQNGKSYRDIESAISKKYIREMKVIDQRLIEQNETGTIIIKNNKVVLTKKGKLLLWLTNNYKYFMLQNSNNKTREGIIINKIY